MSAPWIIPVATVMLGAALWLMLPGTRIRLRPVGALLGAIALGLWASLVAWPDDAIGEVAFGLVAGVTLISAVGAVTFRNPVYCAIWFGLTLLGTAGLFLLSGAQFLAVATIVVYAGAILVTFLFVLMLAQPTGRAYYDRLSWEALVSASVGAAIVGVLTVATARVLAANPPPRPSAEPQRTEPGGVLAGDHVAVLGRELFGRQMISVQVAGILLLVALVGASAIVAQGRGPLVGRGDAGDRAGLRQRSGEK